MKLHLESIIDAFSYDSLPAKWQFKNLDDFSEIKSLFDFQKLGIEKALKALWFYFSEKNGAKSEMFYHYRLSGFGDQYDFKIHQKKDSKIVKYLLEFDKDYKTRNNSISYANFINRMSFWMATGSGKTLMIVKLIDILRKLIQAKELPEYDILFLAHRNDLLDQFKQHVDEFNGSHYDAQINLKSLREYESVKMENALPFAKNEITIFYYRSDLISDDQKESIVDFRNYDNGGKWYILLDEAHKGDKEDSKRQTLYSILSRNGFLFNFSATFTDDRDYATCAHK